MAILRYACGDCIELMKDYPSASIDLIVTDPPYKITPKGCVGTMGGIMATENSKKGSLFRNTKVEHDKWLEQCYRLLKDGSHIYIMTNQVNFRSLCQVAESVGFKYHKALIWDKGNKISGRFYMNSFEFIIFMRKGKAKQINNCGYADILRVPNRKSKGVDGTNLHDTEKPVELMKILVENSSAPGNTVLDPFMGIGSVGVACAGLGRNFVGFEIDPSYFSIAKERFQRMEV